jgi:hypothetical protein
VGRPASDFIFEPQCVTVGEMRFKWQTPLNKCSVSSPLTFIREFTVTIMAFMRCKFERINKKLLIICTNVGRLLQEGSMNRTSPVPVTDAIPNL